MTNAGRRIPTLVLVFVFFVAVPAVALAQEETTTTVAATDTTAGEEAPGSTTDLRPAIPVVDEDVAAAEPQWTYRYLIPTALVLAVLIILVISIRYFSDVVRKRYRVVEE